MNESDSFCFNIECNLGKTLPIYSDADQHWTNTSLFMVNGSCYFYISLDNMKQALEGHQQKNTDTQAHQAKVSSKYKLITSEPVLIQVW